MGKSRKRKNTEKSRTLIETKRRNIIQIDEEINELNDSFERQSQINNEISSSQQQLQESCLKIACLDGKYFQVNLQKSTPKSITAACQLCLPLKELKGSLQTTSNFITHLKTIHKDKYEEFEKYKDLKRETSVHKNVDRRRWACNFSQEIFEQNIVNYILDSVAPINVVERPSFRKIFNDLNIRKGDIGLKHMSRHSVGQKIELSWKETMNDIRLAMKTAVQKGSFICTTADVYTGGSRRFLGVTASWIDSETLLRKSAAIACKRFPGTHSYDAIASYLSQIHSSYDLSPEIIEATVTDNGSNFIKAFREFGICENFIFEDTEENCGDADTTYEDASLEDTVLIDENFPEICNVRLPNHLRCASHTLNLIATTDTKNAINSSLQLKEIHNEVISKCSALWKSLRSPKTNENLKAFLGIALKKPIITRWNSFFDAISQIVSVKQKFLQPDLCSQFNFNEVFTDSDFCYLEEYLLCVTDVARAIDRLQADDIHYGILFPCIVDLRRKLECLLDRSDVQLCKIIVQKSINSLECRFESLFELDEIGIRAAIASVSHPQYRGRWLSCLPSESQKKIYDAFISAVSKESVRAPYSLHENVVDDGFEFGDDSEVINEFQISLSQVELKTETNQFLKSINVTINNLNDYPLIKKVFMKYNTPLPSSAAVERMFSYATMLTLPKFNRLTDNHFEERVLSKANSFKPFK